MANISDDAGAQGGGIPKIIWSMWFQGWDAAPPIVQMCRDSWRRHNEGWELRLLDAQSLPMWLGDVGGPSLEQFPAAASDYVRIQLLQRYGGVWADASVFMTKPLDQWLHGPFFAFSRPGPGRPVASWLLASAPGGLIAREWSDAAVRYWGSREAPDSYYWFHELFGELLSSDPEFRANWRTCASIPAAGPHLFTINMSARALGPPTGVVGRRIRSGVDPVYKLNHRLNEVPEGSAVAWLRDHQPPAVPGTVRRRDTVAEAFRRARRHFRLVRREPRLLKIALADLVTRHR